jgi:SAM-dependent methyltransferase
LSDKSGRDKITPILIMQSKQEIISNVLGIASPDCKVVVDIGYSQKTNIFLKRSGVSVYGVDLMYSAIPEGYDGVYKCDLNTDPLPFGSASVDAVTMGCVLAHVANPLRVLSEINRILKPKGVLIVSSPNPNYYWETILNIFYNYFKKRVSKAKHLEHFFEFSRYTMRTVANRTGFFVENETGCGFHIIKTPLTLSVLNYPGLAYEIIYTLRKIGEPESYATFEGKDGIIQMPTQLYH